MVDQVCIRKGCNWTRTHGMFCRKHKPLAGPVRGAPVCAAVGCGDARDSLSLFCRDHKLAMYRGNGYYGHNVPSPATEPKPVVKAVVKWCPGYVSYYVARHPDYWNGMGGSPGAALRDMRPDDDQPF